MRNVILLGLVLCAGWARAEAAEGGALVEGVMTKHGEPLKNESVTLMRQLRDYKSWVAQTDSTGHYRFKNITPGVYTVGYAVEKKRRFLNGAGGSGWTENHACCFLVEGPGTVTVPPPAPGHILRGKLVLPKDCSLKVAWQGGDERRLYGGRGGPVQKKDETAESYEAREKAYEASEEYKKDVPKQIMLVPEIFEAGTFVVRDVPPGTYKLYIEVSDENGDNRHAGAVFATVEMPDKDYDLPELTVKCEKPEAKGK